jgi:hypothetical protein
VQSDYSEKSRLIIHGYVQPVMGSERADGDIAEAIEAHATHNDETMPKGASERLSNGLTERS